MVELLECLKDYQQMFEVVLGALIALIGTYLATQLQVRQERRQSREREYLIALDNVSNLRMALRQVMNNANDQLHAVSKDRHGDDAKRLDAEGARLVGELFGVVEELDRIGNHLRVYGSRRVVDAHDALSESVWSYLHAVGESTRIDGRVWHKDYVAACEQIESRTREFVDAARKDLGYRKLWRWTERIRATS